MLCLEILINAQSVKFTIQSMIIFVKGELVGLNTGKENTNFQNQNQNILEIGLERKIIRITVEIR